MNYTANFNHFTGKKGKKAKRRKNIRPNHVHKNKYLQRKFIPKEDCK